MKILAIYAIAFGGMLAGLFVTQALSIRNHVPDLFSAPFFQYPRLSILVPRHRFWGPWTGASVFLHVSYAAINIFVVFFRIQSLTDAGRRAGELALVNQIFPLSTIHLSHLADLLGIRWSTCRRIHRATGWMSVALLTVHIIVAVQAQKFTFPLRDLHNLFTMTAAISVGSLALFSIPWFRQWSYEIFLRGHQLLAALFVYGTWQHLEARSVSSKIYFLVALGMFGLNTFLFQLVPLLYRNGLFAGRGYPRAEVSFSIKSNEHNERIDVTAAHVRVSLPRPVQVEAGQYINLWMPAVSLWSWAQTHPFTVTSWAKGPQNTMELLVQPCRGLSAHLARYATKAGETSVSFVALFTGPHGMSEDVRHYESILVIASGFGIAAAIPYIKKMIYGYYTRTLEARRLHLVWQVESRAEITAAEHLLNNLLEDDYKDYGYILNISIYMGDLAMEKLPSGQHKRVCFYQGAPDYRNIISVEASGALIKRQPGDALKRLTNIRDEQRRTLVMASTTGKNRDRIRETVRSYLRQRVKLSELEYQPTESIH